MTVQAPSEALARTRVRVHGVVQGVGFRPHVYLLARELGLTGFVANTGAGVVAEVEGEGAAIDVFCRRVAEDAPPLAAVEQVLREALPPAGDEEFAIRTSREEGGRTLVSPDVATCEACLAELADPHDRRYRHPFVTCTHCGPRFTLVTGLPYDRANTTMARFAMCPRCAAEYADPADRRFHAQPVACHDCGPRLELRHRSAPDEPVAGEPLAGARELLADGAILAVKGLGGYHLACNAADEDAVRRLRARKERGDKPFALLARDVETVTALGELDDAARELLTGPQRPIVLLRRRGEAEQGLVAPSVAPGSPDLGFLLPYTPVHHLLLGLPGDPRGPELLVLTSGNLSGEPIVTDDAEALERLAPLVDGWLLHDRAIHVPCDDSVVRVHEGAPLPLRRSRGYAPLPIRLPFEVPPTLAVGGDGKNTCCLGAGTEAWLSAHLGDMDDPRTLDAFGHAVGQLAEITAVHPELLAADAHPGYHSTRWAQRAAGARALHRVQHHHAHLAALLAEHGHTGESPVLGVVFDGTGWGTDGTAWGGEFLLGGYTEVTRLARLTPAPLPGGDAAVRRPYRAALARLRAAALPWDPELPPVRACDEVELRLLAQQLERGLNAPLAGGMGRLFDTVASLTGLCQHAGYEAQPAIELEAAAVRAGTQQAPDDWTFTLRVPAEGPLDLDPAPLLAAVVEAVRAGTSSELVAAWFHDAVARLVRRVCGALRERHGVEEIALTGGVFANLVLLDGCLRGLRADGFTVLRHRLVPPGDGGLALGQLAVAAHRSEATTEHGAGR